MLGTFFGILLIFFLGALTSRSFQFKGRSWELKSFYAYDIWYSEGIPIVMHYRNHDVLRILPRYSQRLAVWLANRSRIFFLSLKYDRLYYPFIKHVDGFLRRVEWLQVKNLIHLIFKYCFSCMVTLKAFVFFSFSSVSDLINLSAFNLWSNFFSMYFKYITFSAKYSWVQYVSADTRVNYITENKLQEFLKMNLNCVLLIGINLRLEFPLLNSQLRVYVYDKNVVIFSTYDNRLFVDYPFFDLGNVSSFLYNSFRGKDKLFNYLKSLRGTIIVGSYCLQLFKERVFSLSLLQVFFKRYYYYLIFVALEGVGNINSLELGCLHTAFEKINLFSDFIYHSFLNVVTVDKKHLIFARRVFSCYHGAQGNNSLMHCNVIVPCSSYLEENSLYLFLDGFVREITKLYPAPLNARSNYYIFMFLYFTKIKLLGNYCKFFLNIAQKRMQRGFICRICIKHV